jgi:hypothetical protein
MNQGTPNPNHARIAARNSAAAQEQDNKDLAYVNLRKETTWDTKADLASAQGKIAYKAKVTTKPMLRAELLKLDEKYTQAIRLLAELANAERQCLHNMTTQDSEPMDAFTTVSSYAAPTPHLPLLLPRRRRRGTSLDL